MIEGIQPFLVGGEGRFLSLTSTRVCQIKNPWNGVPVGAVFLADDSDARDAITNALRGVDQTRRLSSFHRWEILAFISARIRETKEEFAQLITAEVGKPITWARSEVDRAVLTFTLASEEAKRIGGEAIPLDLLPSTAGRFGIIRRFPVGIVLCITPFNFPLNLVAHKVAPAIAAGNAFILKPAPQAPLTALKLGEIIAASGYPKEAFSVLPCDNEVAESLVSDDRIGMLSFTGSPAVGWMLKSKSGKKRVALELGGNAGVIVDRSADVDDAVRKNIVGSFVNAGQVCIKVQRIYVHEEIFPEYREKFLAAANGVRSGDPSDPETLNGPLIDAAAAERIVAWIAEAVAGGARLLCGGRRKESLVEPTVLEGVDRLAKVSCREVFGPVVTLQSFRTIEEAVADIDDSPYGLQAGIFSNDLKNILYAYNTLDVGGVIVNDNPTFRTDNMPYGGVKESGIGREGVRSAITEMTNTKILVLG